MVSLACTFPQIHWPHPRMPTNQFLDNLLRLRMAVGRYGEMDQAGWWNTKGLLGSTGKTLFSRGFPRTHTLIQARTVFTVANERCTSLLSVPGAATLWRLPAELEDQFESRWSYWLSNSSEWEAFLGQVNETLPANGLLTGLMSLNLITEGHKQAAEKTANQRKDNYVSIGVFEHIDEEVIVNLAASFAAGTSKNLVVPFATPHS